MSTPFLKLIQAGSTAEIADAVQQDPSLSAWRDPQGVSALLWSMYCGQPLVRDFLVARLAAEAEHAVLHTERGTQQICHQDQHFVAIEMAELVVDTLEMVDVDHAQPMRARFRRMAPIR